MSGAVSAGAGVRMVRERKRERGKGRYRGQRRKTQTLMQKNQEGTQRLSGNYIVDGEQEKTENKSERGSQSRLALRFTRELPQVP